MLRTADHAGGSASCILQTAVDHTNQEYVFPETCRSSGEERKRLPHTIIKITHTPGTNFCHCGPKESTNKNENGVVGNISTVYLHRRMHGSVFFGTFSPLSRKPASKSVRGGVLSYHPGVIRWYGDTVYVRGVIHYQVHVNVW